MKKLRNYWKINKKLVTAMQDIAPYKDVIICYASTCNEYEGNRIAKAFDDALGEINERKACPHCID